MFLNKATFRYMVQTTLNNKITDSFQVIDDLNCYIVGIFIQLVQYIASSAFKQSKKLCSLGMFYGKKLQLGRMVNHALILSVSVNYYYA